MGSLFFYGAMKPTWPLQRIFEKHRQYPSQKNLTVLFDVLFVFPSDSVEIDVVYSGLG